MKKALTAFVIAATFIAIGTIYSVFFQPKMTLATSGGSDLVIARATTAASTTVSASVSTTILATSTSRTYASICNNAASIVFINFGNNAQLGKGIRISSGTCYEIADGNLVRTQVNGIASSTQADVSTLDVTGYQGTFGN